MSTEYSGRRGGGRTVDDGGADERRGVADKVAEKLEQKISAAAAKQERAEAAAAEKVARANAQLAKHERAVARAAEKLDKLEAITSRLAGIDVWTRSGPSGRRPRFSRDDIAAAAVRIADDEGFDALSMRRLAAELGAGTMTLYHYVQTKDELLTLLTDEVMGEVALPQGTEMPGHWREALTMLARRTHDVLRRHPWILDINEDPGFGPNSIRHFDQSLEAVASLDLGLRDKLDIVWLVDEYVFGYFMQQRANDEGRDHTKDRGLLEYMRSLLDTGRYPQIARLVGGRGLERSWSQIERYSNDPKRFERNLRRLLDGIEAGLPG